jgi:hypothetical protein
MVNGMTDENRSAHAGSYLPSSKIQHESKSGPRPQHDVGGAGVDLRFVGPDARLDLRVREGVKDLHVLAEEVAVRRQKPPE